jgi:hypothetical protein
MLRTRGIRRACLRRYLTGCGANLANEASQHIIDLAWTPETEINESEAKLIPEIVRIEWRRIKARKPLIGSIEP